MTSHVWRDCPSTSNAVERKNSECKEKHPLPLKAAMINVYNLDKAVCCKHIAASKDSVSYRSKIDEARAADTQRRKKERNAKSSIQDPEALWGPPDKKCNFNVKKGDRKVEQPKRSRCHENDEETPPSKRKCHNDRSTQALVGKRIEMEFTNEDGSTTWWAGKVTKYNSVRDTYEAYFPDDCTTVEFSSHDEDYRVVTK